ncbi:hypothetical protein ACKLNR_008031 [Fusarium oxysporum f. sp. zingiberi]
MILGSRLIDSVGVPDTWSLLQRYVGDLQRYCIEVPPMLCSFREFIVELLSSWAVFLTSCRGTECKARVF